MQTAFKTFEIRVSDEITVIDRLGDVEEFILQLIRQWNNFNDSEPLIIELRKVEGRGPPTFAIKVNDAVDTADKGPGQ